jgi:hypothetical protein
LLPVGELAHGDLDRKQQAKTQRKDDDARRFEPAAPDRKGDGDEGRTAERESKPFPIETLDREALTRQQERQRDHERGRAKGEPYPAAVRRLRGDDAVGRHGAR